MLSAFFRTMIALLLVSFGLYMNIEEAYESQVILRVVHLPSLVLVLSGVLGVALLMCSFKDLGRFFRMMVRVLERDTKRTISAEEQSEALFASYLKDGAEAFRAMTREAALPRVWQLVGSKLCAKLPLTDIRVILGRYANQHMDRFDEDIAILKRLSQLAPSIGMFGSILGLVKMLADLKDFDSLGPNMSLVLLSTLYGIFVGSMVLTPIIHKVEARRNLMVRNHKNLLIWLKGLEHKMPSHYMRHKLQDVVQSD